MAKFNSMYGPGVKKTGQDLSRETEKVFIEVPPFAVNEKGEFLNKTDSPILKENGVVNVQEKIQSFKDDVDIYKILEKVALTGDTSILNQKIGSFADLVNLPDNVNDMNEYIKKATDVEGVSKDILEAAVNEKLSSEDMEKLIAKKVSEAIAAQQKTIENKGGTE